MTDVVAADYGFSTTTNGQETTIQVRASKEYQKVAKVRGFLGNILLLIVAAAPGGCVGGNYNSGFAGVVATIAAFFAMKWAFKKFGKATKLRTTDHTIVISPTTMRINDRGYALKDIRDPHIGNTRDESTVVISKGSQAVVHDMMAKIGFYIAFHYGAEKVLVAMNLSQGQAQALFDEITKVIGEARAAA